MNYKLIIFDLDGVLVDACEWHRIALNEALKEVCDYAISLDDHYKTFNGIPTKTKLQILGDMGIVSKKQHKKIYDLKQKNTINLIKRKAKNRIEKIEMLHFLKEKGYILACYTNSIRLTAELMLTKTGIIHLFEEIITNQDVSKPKPNPEGYCMLIEKFNITKEQTLIIEDSEKGVQAAISSGADYIIVETPEEVNIDLFKEII